MSVPKKNTTWGELLYRGKKYGVLYGFHLSKEILEKYEQYMGDKKCLSSTATWVTIKVTWSIEGDKLYLTKLCTEGLLEKLFGTEKILAYWVNELELLVEHRKICKTYERKGSYLNELNTLHLTFKHGSVVDVYEKTELYRSIEMKNYIDCNPAYATLHIDSSDLLIYLENEVNRPHEDKISPLLFTIVGQMLQRGSENDISLGITDIKNVLKEGELAIFASAIGRDIVEMVESLVDSVTDKFFVAKGCLVYLEMHTNYPLSSVKKIVNTIEIKLDMDETKPYYFGTLLSDDLDEDEVEIRMLVSI